MSIFSRTLVILVTLAAGICHADVVITPQSVTGTAFSATTWAASLSNSDLINAGQSSLGSATVSASAWPAAGMNDGISGNTSSATNTFFSRAPTNFPATATYNLNLTTSPGGYTITSIQSMIGWLTYSKAQANQTYTVEVSYVGSTTYTNLATVSYTPFADVNNTANSHHESRVVITEGNTGVLAYGVDSIRFTFTDPLLSVADGTGTVEGTVIRELDVFGTPTPTLTWDGGAAADDNWQTAGNWQDDSPPSAGAVIHFAGSTRTTNHNDFTAGTAFGPIIFDAGASVFTLGGNAITLLGDISNLSSNHQSINLAMAIPGPRVVNVGGFGMTLGGALTGSGSLTKNDSGTLVLNGNNSGFAGSVSVAAGGALKAGASTALPATPHTINGILDVNGYNLTLGSLAGSGTVTSSATGNPVLTVGNSSDSSFSGVLQNGSATSLGILKQGSGTLSLTATNTITGPITVSEGTLKLGTGGNNANWYPGKPNITVNDGATLTFSGYNVFGNTLASMSQVTVNSGGTVLSSGIATGLVTVFNNLTLNNGTVSINKGDTYGATWGTLGLGGTTTATGNSVINTISGGTGTIANANNLTPTLTILTPAAADHLTISAVIGPVGGNALALTKNGDGTLTLSASNSYTGNTVVNTGTLEVSTGGAINGGTTTVGNTNGNTGTLIISGGTVTTRTGNHFYVGNPGTGIATINSGTLNIGIGSVQTYIGVGAGPGTLNVSGGTVNVGVGDSTTAAKALWIGVNGNGTLNLNSGTLATGRDLGHYGTGGGTVNFNGATLMPASSYVSHNGGFLSGVTAIVKAGGAKIDSNGKDVIIGAVLVHDTGLGATDDGGLTKSGTGTLTLSGTNTYTGATTINGGTLKLSQAGNPAVIPAGTLTVNNGGTLAFGSYNLLGGGNAANFTTTTPVVVNAGGVVDSSATVTTLKNLTLAGGNLRSTGGYPAPWGSFALLGTLSVTADSSILNVSGSNNSLNPGGYNGNQTLTIDVASGATLTNHLPLQDYDGSHVYSITKTGPGTAEFTAVNSYSGNTVVSAGTLRLAAGAQLTFVLGAASGVANSITGAGTAVIDGSFAINTAAAAALASGTWTLENVASLTGAYGSTFSVVGFTDAGNDKWTKTVGDQTFTFDETTGILNLVTKVNVVALFSETDNAYAANVSSSDLVNNGELTLSSFTSSTVPSFGAGGQYDGIYDTASSAAAAYYPTTGAKLPATLTFNLDVSTNTQGYEITGINTFAGWKGGATQTYANQKYSVEYSVVGSAAWVALKSVDYSPFTSTTSNTPANTQVALTDSSGILASGVDAIRFIFVSPTIDDPGGTANGTVIQEIDVIGYPVGGVPPGPSVTVSTPTQRQIVQRTAANTASIPITGTYTGTPDRIEARAVVMAGAANSGTSTDWTTIVAAPSGGTFSGALANVAAGGWYQLEVRSVTGETPGTTTMRGKVGVGDIYLTAGQSNSTNYGSPALTPTDDRVVVRTGLSGNSWRHGYDPMPAPDGSSGGSVWSRLGDLLAAADNIPVGFLCAGWGGTATSQWLPGQSNYTNLRTAIQSFPPNGFRAVLWHQGESDSIANVSAATHASRMASIIGQSRTDAGWSLPWYLAEVSYHPNTHLSQEEPVTAGQRATVYGDPLVFLGPSTDEFHLEDASGGKLADGVHFNAAGLADHANQWCQILRGAVAVGVRNGDFEDNRNATITGLASLADGASHLVNISSDNDSPAVLGWHILSANGDSAADGSNGFHNPSSGTYAAAVDSSNNGVMPNMTGKHVAFLDGGSANNFFLHTTRANCQPNTAYTVNVALGVRDNSSTFGGARIDLLVDGQVAATATYDKSAIDALHGSDAAGSFTPVTLNYVSGPTITTSNQVLAVRIAKVGGAATVLDFDHVTLTQQTGYAAFQIKFWDSTANPAAGATLDPDADGSSNLQEYGFGTDPLSSSSGSISHANGVVTAHGQPTVSIANIPNGVDYRAIFGRRKDYLSAGLSYTVQFSVDMAEGSWVNSTATPEVLASDAAIDAVSVPYPLFIPTSRGVEKPKFFRVGVSP